MAAPFFRQAPERSRNRFEAVPQLESGGAQGRSSIVSEGTADGQAIAARDLGLGIGQPLYGALDRPPPAHGLLQLFLGMPIGLIERLGGLPKIVELAQLMGNRGQGRRHRPPDRVLPIGDNAENRDRQRGLDFAQQGGQVGLGRTEQATRQERLAAQAVADHPEHLVADVRLHPVERQHHAALAGQSVL